MEICIIVWRDALPSKLIQTYLQQLLCINVCASLAALAPCAQTATLQDAKWTPSCGAMIGRVSAITVESVSALHPKTTMMCNAWRWHSIHKTVLAFCTSPVIAFPIAQATVGPACMVATTVF